MNEDFSFSEHFLLAILEMEAVCTRVNSPDRECSCSCGSWPTLSSRYGLPFYTPQPQFSNTSPRDSIIVYKARLKVLDG
jgi:hypothetical protein